MAHGAYAVSHHMNHADDGGNAGDAGITYDSGDGGGDGGGDGDVCVYACHAQPGGRYPRITLKC